MSEIKDIADTDFDELVQLGQCDIVNLCIHERQNMSEELLTVVLAPAVDTLNTSWMTYLMYQH